jgi:hypothetical protein
MELPAVTAIPLSTTWLIADLRFVSGKNRDRVISIYQYQDRMRVQRQLIGIIPNN